MSASLADTALIEACARLKLCGSTTAAEVLQALHGEGHAALTLAEVKKACSKAAKLGAKAVPAAEAERAQPSEAKLAKARRAAELAIKQAEAGMLNAQRELRIAKDDGDAFTAQVATTGRGGAFIQGCSERAISGVLETMGEAADGVVEKRLEADFYTLEWMLLSHDAGSMPLPEQAHAAALRRRDLLKPLRHARDLAAMRACFTVPPDVAAAQAREEEPEVTGDVQGDYGDRSDYSGRGGSARFASIDREIARTEAAKRSGSAEDVD